MMEFKDMMNILQNDIKAVVFSTVDQDGSPHARYINIGVANESGIFFMTSNETNFYQQLKTNPKVAITAKSEEGYLIQVFRIEGETRELGRDQLEEVLKGNEFVKYVYPTKEEKNTMQVFQVYQGEAFYQSLTQGHKYTFRFGQDKE